MKLKFWKSLGFLLALVLVVIGTGCFFSLVSSPTSAPSQPVATTTATFSPSPSATQSAIPQLSSGAYFTGTIQFLNSPVDPEDCWLCDQEEKARLEVDAVYAIHKDIIFLGGFTLFPGAANRSFLLRSTDQGLHWTEVMSTTTRSGVTRIAFIEKGEGWALVTGIGDAGEGKPNTLWHSSDYGLTWQIVGNIVYKREGDSPFCYITGLRFFDSMHGEIRIVCRSPGPSDHFAILSTADGGGTWQKSYHLSLPPQIPGDPGDNRLLAAFTESEGGRYGSHAGHCDFVNNVEICKAFGQDGSEWQSEYPGDTRSKFVIRHRLPTESEWTTYALPACFEYQQGKLIGPCEP